MSNILPQQDAFCIINEEGSFIYVNDLFMNLFNVSEQECYTGLTIQDFIVTPHLVNVHHSSFEEIIFSTLQGNYFAAFILSQKIPQTALHAVSIRINSENIAIKRIITSFRRFIDNQVAIVCLKYSSDNFLPLISSNTDIIDDNPSFIIDIGNELTTTIKHNVREIKNFSGLIQPQKLDNYQNYLSLPYVFQLLVPDSQNETEIGTETFLVAFIFPTALLNLFKDEEKVKGTIKEHLSQLRSPNELSIQFLDEIKQKVVLYFDSQSIEPPTTLDEQLHNLDIYSRYLDHLPYLDALKTFTEFCVTNFKIDEMNIFYGSESTYTKQASTSRLTAGQEKFTSTEYPFYNQDNQGIGYIEIKTKDPNFDQEDMIKAFISKKLTSLFNLLYQANLGFLQELTEILLLANHIPEIFETAKDFVVKIFQSDIKVFAALLYDSETETLNFVSQSGYLPNFNVKSIGLNSNNSVCAKSAREKKLLNIDDVAKCSFYLEGDPSIKSELAIPLVYNNQLIGVLNIESQNKNAFKNDYHIPLFKLICDIVTTNYVRISTLKKVRGILN